MVNFGARMV